MYSHLVERERRSSSPHVADDNDNAEKRLRPFSLSLSFLIEFNDVDTADPGNEFSGTGGEFKARKSLSLDRGIVR